MPPQTCTSSAMQTLADQMLCTEWKYPDSLLIVLGDFNRANLTHELPRSISMLAVSLEASTYWIIATLC